MSELVWRFTGKSTSLFLDLDLGLASIINCVMLYLHVITQLNVLIGGLWFDQYFRLGNILAFERIKMRSKLCLFFNYRS